MKLKAVAFTLGLCAAGMMVLPDGALAFRGGVHRGGFHGGRAWHGGGGRWGGHAGGYGRYHRWGGYGGYGGYRRGGWGGGAVVGGLAAGAVLGGALAAPYYYNGGGYGRSRCPYGYYLASDYVCYPQ